MVQAFKVFTHLVDDQGAILAQHDSPPGGGCCPANTWVDGEIVVDEHTIPLGADLPSGTYQLVVGMYQEETASRLPAYDAEGNELPDGRIPVVEVVVEAAQVDRGPDGTPAAPLFQFDHLIYLPVVAREKVW
jgi:hypothetical protein